MGVIVPEGDFQMSLIWTNSLTSKDFTVTMGLSAPLATPTPTEVADTIYDMLTDDVGSGALCRDDIMAGGWQFQGVSGFQQTEDGPLLGAHLEVVAGTGTDNDVPVNCAVLATKQTAAGGRKNRGRMFLPPSLADLQTDTDGSIKDGKDAFMSGIINTWPEVLVTDNLVMVIHHSDGSAGTAITGFAVSSLLATQRKRMR